LDHHSFSESKASQRWNGRTSFEISIPEFSKVASLLIIEALCIGLAAAILTLSVLIFVLSFGYARSDLGVIILAGASLVGLLGVTVLADIKITKLSKIIDKTFSDAIISNLGMELIDTAPIAHKKLGYLYLTDGTDVSMWEVFYYSDRPEVVSLEKFSVTQYDKYLQDGTIKFAS
jgi:hypothetical protein